MLEIEVQRLTTGAVFKLVGRGLAFTLIPFSVLMGVLALFGAGTVDWNDEPATGFSGLIVAPLIGLFVTGVFTLVGGGVAALGLWIGSFVGSTKISYWPK